MAEQDRRIRRTRRMLSQALIALILERGYERLTVQDILDRADVGRSTFYAHFRDKEALLLACFDDVREQLTGELAATAGDAALPDPARAVAALYGHAYRHREVYRALCGRQGGHLVHRHLRALLGDLLRDSLRRQPPADADLPLDVVVEFCTSAALGLLIWWVGEDYPRGPRWLSEAYRRLAAPGVGAAAS